MADYYRKLTQQKAELWRQLAERLATAGLPPAAPEDFTSESFGKVAVRPLTRKGWAVYQELLESEGTLDAIAIKEIKRGLERIDIADREAAIRARLRAGERIFDPAFSDSNLSISGELGRTVGTESILHWTAINELGLGGDDYYRDVASRARIEMYEIARRRGDFREAFYYPRPEASAVHSVQHGTEIPDSFVPLEIRIQHGWIVHPERSIMFVRYDPQFGLVQGYVDRYSEYDRGAGGFLSGRGARVTWFTPRVDAFLANVNMKKCKGLHREGVWWITGDPAAIVGRNRSTTSIQSKLSCGHRFESEDNAKKWIEGAIDSYFVQETLPVAVARCGPEYRLNFWARPLDLA